MEFQIKLIIRIFDEGKAKGFNLGFHGLKLDWGRRFELDFPIYMQASRENRVFHLSEHSGECVPGSKVFVNINELYNLHEEVISKGYKYNKPVITTAP